MAKISYSARKLLPKSEFAVPSKKTASNPAGKGGYPIDTKNRARNALARVSQFGTSEVKARVRAKVHAKFPGIKQHDGGRQPKMHGGPVHGRQDRQARGH